MRKTRRKRNLKIQPSKPLLGQKSHIWVEIMQANSQEKRNQISNQPPLIFGLILVEPETHYKIRGIATNTTDVRPS